MYANSSLIDLTEGGISESYLIIAFDAPDEAVNRSRAARWTSVGCFM